jgi:hypothetical protein
LSFTLAGLTPAEQTSLRWMHNIAVFSLSQSAEFQNLVGVKTSMAPELQAHAFFHRQFKAA